MPNRLPRRCGAVLRQAAVRIGGEWRMQVLLREDHQGRGMPLIPCV